MSSFLLRGVLANIAGGGLYSILCGSISNMIVNGLNVFGFSGMSSRNGCAVSTAHMQLQAFESLLFVHIFFIVQGRRKVFLDGGANILQGPPRQHGPPGARAPTYFFIMQFLLILVHFLSRNRVRHNSHSLVTVQTQ